MCLALYLASDAEVPTSKSADFSVDAIRPDDDAVRQWFSLPHVRFIGGHTICSCAFPSVMADVPVDYYEGMEIGQPDTREADLRSLAGLLSLLGALVGRGASVELMPVWNGNEAQPPKGTLTMSLEAVEPTQFFFNEQYLYRVTR